MSGSGCKTFSSPVHVQPPAAAAAAAAASACPSAGRATLPCFTCRTHQRRRSRPSSSQFSTASSAQTSHRTSAIFWPAASRQRRRRRTCASRRSCCRPRSRSSTASACTPWSGRCGCDDLRASRCAAVLCPYAPGRPCVAAPPTRMSSVLAPIAQPNWSLLCFRLYVRSLPRTCQCYRTTLRHLLHMRLRRSCRWDCCSRVSCVDSKRAALGRTRIVHRYLSRRRLTASHRSLLAARDSMKAPNIYFIFLY